MSGAERDPELEMRRVVRVEGYVGAEGDEIRCWVFSTEQMNDDDRRATLTIYEPVPVPKPKRKG